jgi:hypothetical protein
MLRNNVDDQRSDLPFVPHLQYSQWIPENGVNAVCESVVQRKVSWDLVSQNNSYRVPHAD